MVRVPMIQFRYGKRPFPVVSYPSVHPGVSQVKSAQTFTTSSSSSSPSNPGVLSFKDTPAKYLRPRIPEFEIAMIDAGGAVDPPKPVKPTKKK